MKKLNKKGFTLVELLAVVVILAILIAVVASTAIPAMTGAKEKAAETYADRLNAKAKEDCLVKTLNTDTSADEDCKYTSVKDLMGAENSQYQINDPIIVDITDDGAEVTGGTIQDKKNTTIEKDVKD